MYRQIISKILHVPESLEGLGVRKRWDEWSSCLYEHNFQKVRQTEDRLLEIKKGMLTGNINRLTASLKCGATHPFNMHLLSASFTAATISRDH